VIIDLTSLTDDLWLYGLKILGLILLGRLGWLLIDLAIGLMRQHGEPVAYAGFDHDPSRDLTAVLDATRQIPAEDEPFWPGKAPLYETDEDGPHSVTLAGVVTSARIVSGVLPATESETSGRHAHVEPDDVTVTATMDRGELLAGTDTAVTT
jgi:hypothetical protein